MPSGAFAADGGVGILKLSGHFANPRDGSADGRGVCFDTTQARIPQVRTNQVRSIQVRTPQVRITQVRSPQIRTPQVRKIQDCKT